MVSLFCLSEQSKKTETPVWKISTNVQNQTPATLVVLRFHKFVCPIKLLSWSVDGPRSFPLPSSISDRDARTAQAWRNCDGESEGPGLSHVTLKGCQIGDDGAKALAAALKVGCVTHDDYHHQ